MLIDPCVVIPIYNNRDTIRAVVEAVDGLSLPCFIVDDGSDAETRQELALIENTFERVVLIRRTVNGGKGAAMRDGFKAAFGRGHTHALQVDADGQHEVSDIPRFLDEAKHDPGALILSFPEFAVDAPKSRRYGRLVTTFFVWIETLSTEIRDTLCGFRCYPLAPVMQLYETASVGEGMVFDTEIAVRLFWAGTPVRHVKTKIHYFDGGVSHFDYVGDNLRISWMHTRLLGGMLVRLPRLLGRRPTS